VATDKGGIVEGRPVNWILGGIINGFRAAPFIILLVALLAFIGLERQPIRLIGRGIE
jgi:D-methionine transport system permease protein